MGARGGVRLFGKGMCLMRSGLATPICIVVDLDLCDLCHTADSCDHRFRTRLGTATHQPTALRTLCAPGSRDTACGSRGTTVNSTRHTDVRTLWYMDCIPTKK